MSVRNLIPAVLATLAVLIVASAGWAAPSTNTDPQQPCADACDAEPDCCTPYCGPHWQFFGDLLYLRPRNDGQEYAVPINGPISTGAIAIQEGRTASLNPQFEPGFRVGGGFDFDCCSNISASFTHYENSVDDAISVNPPFVIRSMVMHPSTLDAAADWNSASAHQFMKFDLVDLDFRHVFYCTERSTVNYLVGLRYANLDQQFTSQFDSIISANVDANVNFDGGGFRLGLEGQRTSDCHNIFVYGKAAASFLGGEFRGNYLQSNANDPVVAETDWKEARLVSILDCEVGIGWTSCNGHVRASAGYMVSGWLNFVKTPEYIAAVQANQYHGPDKIDGNALVFDGLVAHLELRR
jgi:Legionella pneumophila major outer membrane protein precursor